MTDLMFFNGDDYFGDLAILHTYLLIMNDNIVSSTDRNKMVYINSKIGGSALYGVTWKKYITKTRNKTPSKIYKGLYQTKLVDLYPEFADISKEFSNLYFPYFVYTQIQINRSFPCPPHFDSKNQGESIIIGFGDYGGGDLVINKMIDNNSYDELYDIRDRPIRFNGSKYKHYTNEFSGERYSLVFFNNIKNIESKLI